MSLTYIFQKVRFKSIIQRAIYKSEHSVLRKIENHAGMLGEDISKLKIVFIKKDIEVAELLIYKRTSRFIKECQPIMFAEIFELNLKNYLYFLEYVYHYITSEMINKIFQQFNQKEILNQDDISKDIVKLYPKILINV